MKPRILIVEDNPVMQDLLAGHLEAQGHDVRSTFDLASTLSLLEQWVPDVVLLDLTLADGQGHDLLPVLQSMDHPRTLVISARDRVSDRVEALQAGADGYLVKPFALVELQARIQALLRRNLPHQRTLTLHGTTLDPAAGTLQHDGHSLGLTEHEVQVLAWLMAHPGRPVKKQQLETQVYGWDLPGSNSIEVRVSQVRKKLQQVKSPLTIKSVRGVGYLLQTPPAEPGPSCQQPQASPQDGRKRS